tara:strand:- start:882 stop:1574 length:693 start_codon:yes stop_codon:yes gene_type:complete
MIDNVRKVVHDFLEKDNRGWIQPERFNRYAYLAQIEIFESYFYEYNRWLNLQNKRMSNTGYSDIPKNIREKLDMFQKDGALTYSIDRFTSPADNYRVINVFSGVNEVVPTTKRRATLLNKSNLTAPSTDYPIYYKLEDDFIILPSTIVLGVEVSYIRKPATPKWTYVVISNNPVFNPSSGSYQDFEIHPSDEYKLVSKILSYVGVSVREQDIVQYAEGQLQKQTVNENRA